MTEYYPVLKVCLTCTCPPISIWYRMKDTRFPGVIWPDVIIWWPYHKISTRIHN